MIRRPPRSTLDRSSAASDVYKRQDFVGSSDRCEVVSALDVLIAETRDARAVAMNDIDPAQGLREHFAPRSVCLLYTSDAADERSSVDLGGRRIIKKKKKQHI